ncbi:uncharacterized protein LOC18447215 [Amborella trichopoda]|uniref:uncharacterized protein LOC18447215 n=1 Tax=Amborella trichopoda TaxID=13333 RepID=UPI0005D365D0|nr:uncharacterized protein LOC18447215 [Amborella trichopoda]|eukprot:XP_011628135.1 uncharacterized protein LOC18447215 [Amborella trichopoda]
MGIPLHHSSAPNTIDTSSDSYTSTTNTDSFNACNNGSHLSLPNNYNPSYLFVYGSSRPDAPGSSLPLSGYSSRRAWLLGSRLYSFVAGGIYRAAVKLDESGNAVTGYAVSADNSLGIAMLLDEYERREFSPEFYQKNIVQVITDRGERLSSYIYHRTDLNPNNIISSGDWFLQ